MLLLLLLSVMVVVVLVFLLFLPFLLFLLLPFAFALLSLRVGVGDGASCVSLASLEGFCDRRALLYCAVGRVRAV